MSIEVYPFYPSLFLGRRRLSLGDSMSRELHSCSSNLSGIYPRIRWCSLATCWAANLNLAMPCVRKRKQWIDNVPMSPRLPSTVSKEFSFYSSCKWQVDWLQPTCYIISPVNFKKRIASNHSSILNCPFSVPIQAMSVRDARCRLHVSPTHDLLYRKFHLLVVMRVRDLGALHYKTRHMPGW